MFQRDIDDKRPPNISYAPFFKLYAIWRVIRYIRLLIVAHDFGSSRTDLLHVVTQASTNALPAPMLRQVYVGAQKRWFCVGGPPKMASWRCQLHFLTTSSYLEASWAHLGRILGRLGLILGPSWVYLGPSWGHTGPSGTFFPVVWGFYFYLLLTT